MLSYEDMNYYQRIGWRKGMRKGMLNGEKIGKEKGEREGLSKGISQGVSNAKGEVIHNMLAMGMEIEVIARAVNLDKEKVQEIIREKVIA